MFEFENEINCGPCGVRHLHLCRSFTYMFIIYFFVLLSNIYTLCLWLTSSQITYLFIIDFVICTSGSIINLFIIYFFILFSNIYTGVSVSIISLFVIDFFVLLSNIYTGVSVSIISLFIIDFFVLLSNIYTGVTGSQVHRSQSFNFIIDFFELLSNIYTGGSGSQVSSRVKSCSLATSPANERAGTRAGPGCRAQACDLGP